MEDTQNPTCRKNDYQKVTFEHKLLPASVFQIDQINNGLFSRGQISANFASKKYNILRATIHSHQRFELDEKIKQLCLAKNCHFKIRPNQKTQRKIEDLDDLKEFQ